MVVFGQTASNWANCFDLGKSGSVWEKGGCICINVVVFGQIGFIWTKVVLFGQTGFIW